MDEMSNLHNVIEVEQLSSMCNDLPNVGEEVHEEDVELGSYHNSFDDDSHEDE